MTIVRPETAASSSPARVSPSKSVATTAASTTTATTTDKAPKVSSNENGADSLPELMSVDESEAAAAEDDKSGLTGEEPTGEADNPNADTEQPTSPADVTDYDDVPKITSPLPVSAENNADFSPAAVSTQVTDNTSAVDEDA